jgi:hypothetical protein
MSAYRIEVSTKGETGYLHTDIPIDMHARYALTVDENRADSFPTAERAERHARRVQGRFDTVKVVAA